MRKATKEKRTAVLKPGPDREHISTGSNQNRPLGNTQEKDSGNTSSLSGFNPLRLSFKPKHRFEVEHTMKGTELIMETLDICEQLFPVIQKYCKHYKLDLNEPDWTEGTKPHEILQWLTKTIERCFPKNVYWHITRYSEDEDKKYNLAQYQYHEKDTGPITMGLAFLPGMKKANPLLHDFVFDCIISAKKHLDLSILPLNFFDTMEVLGEELLNAETAEDKKLLKETKKVYGKGGIAYEYFARIDSHKTMSEEKLKALAKKVKTKKSIELEIMAWAKAFRDKAHHPNSRDISHYYDYHPSDPDREEEYPIVLSSICGFLWDPHDHVTELYDDWINADYNNAGEAYPCSWKIISTRNCENLVVTDWLEGFLKLLDIGRTLTDKYIEIYGRNTESKQLE